MIRSSRRKEAPTKKRKAETSQSLLTSAATSGKLLLVRTGNIRSRDLKALFERHLPEIIAALEANSLVELDRQTVRVIV